MIHLRLRITVTHYTDHLRVASAVLGRADATEATGVIHFNSFAHAAAQKTPNSLKSVIGRMKILHWPLVPDPPEIDRLVLHALAKREKYEEVHEYALEANAHYNDALQIDPKHLTADAG